MIDAIQPITLTADPRPFVLVHPRRADDPDRWARLTLATADRYAQRWGLELHMLNQHPTYGMTDPVIIAQMQADACAAGYRAGGVPPGYLYLFPERPPSSDLPLTQHFDTEGGVEEYSRAFRLASDAYPELADPRFWDALTQQSPAEVPSVFPISAPTFGSQAAIECRGSTGGLWSRRRIRFGEGVDSCQVTGSTNLPAFRMAD
jgi:hypothetical protein